MMLVVYLAKFLYIFSFSNQFLSHRMAVYFIDVFIENEYSSVLILNKSILLISVATIFPTKPVFFVV